MMSHSERYCRGLKMLCYCPIPLHEGGRRGDLGVLVGRVFILSGELWFRMRPHEGAFDVLATAPPTYAGERAEGASIIWQMLL